MSRRTTLVLALLMTLPMALSAGGQEPAEGPHLVTDRALERTGFQESSPYDPRYDLRTDFVMAYGVGPDIGDRLARWIEAGYVPQVMTGVAWGEYQDYLDGKFDDRKHWDEGQVDAAGNPINHGATVPYMVPSVAFSRYLEAGVRRAIDGGAVAVHLEEPEFWARAGYSEAFQREWRLFYNEPWRRPDADPDAQYRASKLKYYLYRRTLDRLCAAMKEYALTRHSRTVRFYVPTHSLLNYTQWDIVSPQSALLDLPGVDGYIAQVWTGTARTPNVYAGVQAERTFETAYLEYGIMQELVRDTGRRMWFLDDPIEDNPRHDWNDYRKNYVATLVAALLQPAVWHYEVAPWPRRIFLGRYPRRRRGGMRIPPDYATALAVVFNQLRDMEQRHVSWPQATEGVGVFLADSAMFQRAGPAFTAGLGDGTTLDRQTATEARMFSGFYGLALPPLERGIPIHPVQLDNVARFPSYLRDFRVLLLSYEFLKPLSPGLHLALAAWVRNGGSLVYVGADTDPFHGVSEWWNRPPAAYASPSEHLFEVLGLPRRPKTGEYHAGDGLVIVERAHPASFTRSAARADRLRQLVRRAVEAAGGKYVERGALELRRGPYVIAARLEESRGGVVPEDSGQSGRVEESDEGAEAGGAAASSATGEPDESLGTAPLVLTGRFVDLLDAELPVRTRVEVEPGRQVWLLDLDAVTAKPPLVLAAAGRVESWAAKPGAVAYTLATPEGVEATARLLLPERPASVSVDGKPVPCEWDAPTRTAFVRHPGHPGGVHVEMTW